MWTMCKMHEVWHLCDRYPDNRFIFLYIIHQYSESLTRKGFGYLLMASPTLALRGQAGGRSAKCAGVTVQTLHAQLYMDIMSEFNGLFRRLLCRVESICSNAEYGQHCDKYPDSPHGTQQPFKNSLDHAGSCDEFIREIMHEIILNQLRFVNNINLL